jgi:alkanesulfonate monooxygenase SsuD/methylene tetrahydromethanopterin reductase-like flavin-dependent oxidoreductase (luciferase family)
MARRRPIGRDSDAYQAMLASLVELVQAADTLGYWGITHVEHHAHSEGLEISPDPLLLNVYLGHFTKRLMHGQLGIVVPTHDPVRLAAQIAIADHMLKGRLFVGMARLSGALDECRRTTVRSDIDGFGQIGRPSAQSPSFR